MSLRRAIVVVGPQPGAAAVARMLGLFGVDFASPSARAEISALGGRVYAALGTAERDPYPLPVSWWEQAEVRALGDPATALLERHFDGRALFGFEDAAAARLLPFWNQALERLGAQLSLVIVAQPQAGAWRSEVTWIDRLLEAELHSRALKRVFVSYEAYLDDWRTTAQRIAARLQVVWPVPAVAMSETQERAVEEERRSHAEETAPPAQAGATLAQALYAECLELERRVERGEAEDFGPRRRDYDRARQTFLPALQELEQALRRGAGLDAELAEKTSRLRALEESLAQAKARQAQAEGEIDALYRSRSWRITKPLRQFRWLVDSLLRLIRERPR